MSSIHDSSGEKFFISPFKCVTLSANHVSKVYTSFTKGRTVAVDDANLSIREGERICVVGESGSGKTTLAKILCGLITPTSGEVSFMGKCIDKLNRGESKAYRRLVQYIPQCPDLSLDPTWYIYDSIAEPLRIQKVVSSKKDELDRVRYVCDRVGINTDQLKRKPRNVSGGELQRAVIARALILNPKIIIADEPTSMLDPSIQAKIVRMILDLQTEFEIGVAFITHDLRLASLFSERIFVMHGGRIIESGPTHEVLKSPLHPYTKSLLQGSSPTIESTQNSSCKFYNECDMRSEICLRNPPPQCQVGEGRNVRCWIYV